MYKPILVIMEMPNDAWQQVRESERKRFTLLFTRHQVHYTYYHVLLRIITFSVNAAHMCTCALAGLQQDLKLFIVYVETWHCCKPVNTVNTVNAINTVTLYTVTHTVGSHFYNKTCRPLLPFVFHIPSFIYGLWYGLLYCLWYCLLYGNTMATHTHRSWGGRRRMWRRSKNLTQ